ncbi:MAG: phytanoyl-CoA dioxygenase family protein [Acidimicrobiales bacterium]
MTDAMAGRLLSAELASRWRTDGWCVIAGAFSGAELADAQAAVRGLFPSAEEMDAGVDDERTSVWRRTDGAPWPEFPFDSAPLNRLVVSEALIDMAQELLAVTDVRLYQATLTAKYSNQSSGYNQLLHTDYPNHTIVVPRPDDGYQQLETYIYLSDVTADDGATRLVSRRLTDGIPVERHTLRYDDYAHLYAEPGDASGPAGSVVAYRPDVYHRAVDVSEPGRSRFMLHVAYKAAEAEWAGYQAWQFKGFTPAWHNFVQGAGVRQLGVVGFPAPGHPYWTEETLRGVQARYPNLDMDPWKAAFTVGSG